MIRYNSAHQLSIEEFRTPFEMNMDKENRWVLLGALIPWDALARVYYSMMDADRGAPAVDARIVIGALIVKHKEGLDDRRAIEYIRENPYVQYFLGLSTYTSEAVFDRSLFTHLRHRIGAKEFDCFNREIIGKAEEIEKQVLGKGHHKKQVGHGAFPEKKQEEAVGVSPETQAAPPSCVQENKGQLQIDATVADQMISWPTDLGLLHTSREESERLIDTLHKRAPGKKKPRTYRRVARKRYLAVAKKKHRTKKEIRKGIGQQLHYLQRNIRSIHQLLDVQEADGALGWPLGRRDQKIFWVIQQICSQQKQMHTDGSHRHSDRIVNIYQPHVRPIVRGKAKGDVEFGAKLGVSLEKGFARISTISWNAYNENTDLKKQAEAYKEMHGYYPEVILADGIYGTRENRGWMKERHIRFSGKTLGRPSQTPVPYAQRRELQKERNQRNHIEGKFGQGKNGYNLSRIRARVQGTSESWISCIFFVMNLVALMKIADKAGAVFLFAFFLTAIALAAGAFYAIKERQKSRCAHLFVKST